MTILADGRRLWRVFDNLMNNIWVRPAGHPGVPDAGGARRPGGDLLQNTSRAPLDIPAEELLERFVRGDRRPRPARETAWAFPSPGA